MKISTREVASIISSPPPRFCIYLLYGQDNGLMAERSKMLERHFTNGDNDPSAVVSLASAEVGRDKTLLCDNLNAIPMFGGKRVVLLSGQGSEMKDAVLLAAEQMARDSKLIIKAYDVNTRHALVTFCDKLDICASIGCYPDDSKDLSQLVQDIFGQYQIQYSRDVLHSICEKLGADRQASRSEIEKLALFAGKGGHLTIDDISLLLGDGAALQADLLNMAILTGNIEQFNAHLARLKREAVAPIRLLRQLLGLFRVMQLAYNEQGQADVKALDLARPPLHFKIKPIVQRAVSAWTAILVDEAIEKLISLEINLKSSGSGDGFALTGQTLLGLLLRARSLQHKSRSF